MSVSKKLPAVSEEPVSSVRVIREYAEALAVALVLAFFFKAFAIEAFVIPTGSMAPTLMGRHKDVTCNQCGMPFQLGASEESNDGSERPRPQDKLPQVLTGTCPQCQHTMYVGRDNAEKKTFLSFNGDRIFVNKSLFDFRQPNRWHVTVFRYPAKPQANYIKRLIGLENETVMLRNGDVFTQKPNESEFQIERKPLRQLLAMLRPVDDNDHVLPQIHQLGFPTRWYSHDNLWQRSEDYRSFKVIGDEEVSWLNYRNIVASTDDWFHFISKEKPPHDESGRPQLITDYTAYNSTFNSDYFPGASQIDVTQAGKTSQEIVFPQNPGGMGLNWVGDLAVGCRVTIDKTQGSVLFRLVKGGIVFLCEIDLSTGNAMLSIPEVPEFPPVAVATPLNTAKSADVMFCNVDEELRLVIDGKEIGTQGKGRYDTLCQPGSKLAWDRSPSKLDLEPAGIGVRSAGVRIEHLKVQRDMYYIACDAGMGDWQCDLLQSPFSQRDEGNVRRILSTPEEWTNFGKTRLVTFKLEKDQFLMLGDNSARSKDGRLWTSDGIPYYVDRKFLIGEAFFVYWPHGLRIPGTKIALIPNVFKMRLID